MRNDVYFTDRRKAVFSSLLFALIFVKAGKSTVNGNAKMVTREERVVVIPKFPISTFVVNIAKIIV